MRRFSTGIVTAGAVVAFSVGLSAPSPANATLALTAAGISDGFTLSQFAALNTGNNGGFGPFGVGVGANVIVSNYPNNTIYTFNDVDLPQTPATALNTIPGAGTGTVGMAISGGNVYGYDPATGHFAEYNSNGTINHDLTGVAAGPDLGMAGVLAGPEAGHIIATSSVGIIDIDPNANGGLGSIVHNYGISNGDGVSTSPDGLTFCVEQGAINCYSVATGALTASASGFPSPDGTGIITGGTFNNDLIVNNNNGNVDLFDFGTKTLTTIASGNERGDYAMTDPSNGTLLLDESTGIWRLGVTGGCIGANCNPTVPEPPAMSLFGAALMMLGVGALVRVKYSR
jgi:hypothetical protein